VSFGEEVIRVLSEGGALKCSFEEARSMCDFKSVSVVSSRSKASSKRESSKKRTAGPKPILPFCGLVKSDWCSGVKFNHGLHTQCTMGQRGTDIYCSTCRKDADQTATGKPSNGDINDRSAFGLNYISPLGRTTVAYANVVAKKGISMALATAELERLGWEMPVEQLTMQVKRKKVKRGRPTKPVEATTTQEDQINQLVAEAYAASSTKVVVKKLPKIKLSIEQKAEKKEAADLIKAEKKEAADLIKAEKKAASDALKAEKKAVADAIKAEKKAVSDALKVEKKAAADLIKAEKKAVSDALKAEKKAVSDAIKAEKKAVSDALKAEKDSKKDAADLIKAEKKKAADLIKAEKVALKLKEKEDKALAKTAAKEAKQAAINQKALDKEALKLKKEAEVELVEDMVDSSDDESDDEGLELSETMSVNGEEYYFTEQDGQTILFSKTGEPIGVYDAETETIQECEFGDE